MFSTCIQTGKANNFGLTHVKYLRIYLRSDQKLPEIFNFTELLKSFLNLLELSLKLVISG